MGNRATIHRKGLRSSYTLTHRCRKNFFNIFLLLRRFFTFLNVIFYFSNTHTHRFNGTFSRTTQVSRYQKGKTNLDFTGARDSEWQWHQLGRMQVCTSLHTDNHTNTPSLGFYKPDDLPVAQPTASKH